MAAVGRKKTASSIYIRSSTRTYNNNAVREKKKSCSLLLSLLLLLLLLLLLFFLFFFHLGHYLPHDHDDLHCRQRELLPQAVPPDAPPLFPRALLRFSLQTKTDTRHTTIEERFVIISRCVVGVHREFVEVLKK